MSNSFFVYLLLCSDNSTYVGATVDLNHRLRQHNNELKGGARATTMKVKQGKIWQRVCHIANFPDWRSALQFEWRWKQLSRKLPHSIHPLERRMMALKELLSLEKSTTLAVPYRDWETPIQVNIEMEEAHQFYT
jgi:predicted GIY-YIG superfamily endonuclease